MEADGPRDKSIALVVTVLTGVMVSDLASTLVKQRGP